jgi:hypothetical protein
VRPHERPSKSKGGDSGVASVLLALAVLLPAMAVAEEPARKDVLLLYADSMLLPANVVVDRELRSRLGANAATPVHFYTESSTSRGSQTRTWRVRCSTSCGQNTPTATWLWSFR